ASPTRASRTPATTPVWSRREVERSPSSPASPPTPRSRRPSTSRSPDSSYPKGPSDPSQKSVASSTNLRLGSLASVAMTMRVGLGDLGEHFPDTDMAWKDAESLTLLARVADLVRGAGWQPANVDCSVVLDAPKLAPHRRGMEERLGRAAGAPITVKPRRAEGL